MYKIKENGVILIEGNLLIPEDEFNRHWNEYQDWLKAGNTPEPLVSVEEAAATAAFLAREQRDTELARADIQLLKVEDGAKGLGTQKAWREYRNALRNWPETENFPEVMPVAPDAK
jgi:hypothetical protein